MKKPSKELKISLIYSAIALIIIVALSIIPRKSVAFAEWYATHVYVIWQAILSRISGIFPFSIYELLIIIGIIIVFYIIVRTIYLAIKKRGRRILTMFGRFVVLLITIVLLYVLNCGVNYHRRPFSYYSGLTINKESPEVLIYLGLDLIERANALVPYIDTVDMGEDGQIFSLADTDARIEAVLAMNKLGETYSVLSGYYPKPKPVLFSKVMSYEFITGVYSAFSIEANYNNDVTDNTIPFTMCHELSHLRGFMREDEANFIAYLACIGSDNVNIQYSGYTEALGYVLNSIYKEFGAEVYTKVYLMMDPQIMRDYNHESIYWDAFETPVAEVADAVNNVYLQANAQTDGVKSYGRMVDLLIAYYLANNPSPE